MKVCHGRSWCGTRRPTSAPGTACCARCASHFPRSPWRAEPHVLLLAQDVSERALLERQLRQAQKMEAIGQLAAGVAHDFNNILTVIQGHAGLMQLTMDRRHPARQVARADHRRRRPRRHAHPAACSMFSRKQVMQFRHLDLNDILRNAIKMLERLVGEHVRIEFQPQDSLPAIHADSSMVEQIAMNLAVNARDAMPNGGQVFITTSLENIQRAPTPMDPERRDGEFICLTFRDTGTGMDTQILSRIFEPFFTTKAVGKGTGLGLSTVFGIVRQHQGWLEVESKPNQGTTFRVLLSRSADKAAEKMEPVVDTAPARTVTKPSWWPKTKKPCARWWSRSSGSRAIPCSRLRPVATRSKSGNKRHVRSTCC